MISKYNHKRLNWIDLESPKEDELLHVIEQYSLPSSIKDKILAKTTKDEINIDYNSIYASVANNIIFVVDDSFVLTIHYKPIEAFNEFSKEMELDLTGEGKIDSHRKLFAHLLKNLYINSEKQLSASKYRIEKLNQHIISNKKMIKKLVVIILLLVITLFISIWL